MDRLAEIKYALGIYATGCSETLLSKWINRCKWLAAELETTREEVAGWKRVALNRAEECGTCDGLGVMDVLAKVEPPDGLEVYEPVVCAECLGTGRGVIAKLLADARGKGRDPDHRLAETTGA